MTVNAVKSASETETLACLVIDDPLLKPKYGCIDYKRLLREMKAHNFFTEVAFIPWNYKRSDAETVRLLANNPDYFAICVHGCNHIGNEFGIGDYDELRDLSSAALWRMEQHKKLTGLPYDPIIVFPQGRFSSVAISALKDVGYFAAVNTTIRATDREEPSTCEYQRAATTAYHDFPMFLRRYPKDRSCFVQDVGCGRPIIIVEHHCVFRNGYKEITDLVDWINTLGNIKWTSLLGIAEHYLEQKAPVIRQLEKPASPRLDVRAKIALRRLLSEVRDNHIETSNLLTKAYKMVRSRL